MHSAEIVQSFFPPKTSYNPWISTFFVTLIHGL